LKDLLCHQNLEHGHNYNIESAAFSSEDDFKSWKDDLEKKSGTYFVKTCGDHSRCDHTIAYFHCNRAGTFKPAGKGKRALKSQGTSKLGRPCCAFMKKTTYRAKGGIKVEYCVDHSHSTTIAHLKMSAHIRSNIAGKLASGADTKDVLNDIRGMAHQLEGRDSIITHKDIRNIKYQHNISSAMRHEDDSSSTSIWVSALKAQDYNPVVIFKQEGVEKFALGIQTEFQRDIMAEFGNELICIDSTDSTTQYDILVTTIVVADDYGDAIPVAWLISDKEDTDILDPFLSAIQSRVGDLTCETFMSDLTNDCYNAWCSVFPKPGQRLYCSWQVQKNWKMYLNSRVEGEANQNKIYGMIEILLKEPCEQTFRKILTESLTKFTIECPEFHKYFYYNHVEDEKFKLWALCFRNGTTANTNMYVEAMNRVLQRRQNKRVDELLSQLLMIARDKAHERYSKLEKGKLTYWTKEMENRHKKIDEVKNIQTKLKNKKWSIPSTSRESVVYEISRARAQCNCKLKCHLCDVCLHMFSCTCLDFLVQSVACKHTHAIQVLCESDTDTDTESDTDSQSPSESEEQDQDYDPNVSDVDEEHTDEEHRESDLSEIKRASAREVHELLKVIMSAPNADTVRKIMPHVRAATAVGNGLALVSKYLKKHSCPNNKSDEKKQTKKASASRLKKKPSQNARKKVKTRLEKTDPRVCALCFKTDNALDSHAVDWKECSKCKMCVHNACDIQIQGTDGDDNLDDFICVFCQ
jgi:hypothetical protein